MPRRLVRLFRGWLLIWGDQPDPPVGPFVGTASAGSVLRFVLGAQRRTVVVGAVFGIGWMGSMAAMPAVLGVVIDRGLTGGGAALVGWLAVLMGVGMAEAGSAVVRHRMARRLLHTTILIGQQLVGRRVLDARGGLERVPPGEVVSRAMSDTVRIA